MIRLRPFMDSDAEEIISWCGDEDTFYKWTFGVIGEHPITREKFDKTGAFMRFTAFDETGSVGFYTARNPGGDPDHLRFGFGIVRPDRRCQGVGKAMLQAGLDFAFRIYGAKKVSLGVYEENRIGYNCYSAIGFKETGVKETYLINGEEYCALEMAAVKEY